VSVDFPKSVRHTIEKSNHQTGRPTLRPSRAAMTSQLYTTSQHYTVETEQPTALAGEQVRRIVGAKEDPGAPQFDAAALTAALNLGAKPVSSGAARKVAATYAIPHDSLMARRRRASSVT
jgi:hypothetical protein